LSERVATEKDRREEQLEWAKNNIPNKRNFLRAEHKSRNSDHGFQGLVKEVK
jgi:hypothetical protein